MGQAVRGFCQRQSAGLSPAYPRWGMAPVLCQNSNCPFFLWFQPLPRDAWHLEVWMTVASSLSSCMPAPPSTPPPGGGELSHLAS